MSQPGQVLFWSAHWPQRNSSPSSRSSVVVVGGRFSQPWQVVITSSPCASPRGSCRLYVQRRNLKGRPSSSWTLAAKFSWASCRRLSRVSGSRDEPSQASRIRRNARSVSGVGSLGSISGGSRGRSGRPVLGPLREGRAAILAGGGWVGQELANEAGGARLDRRLVGVTDDPSDLGTVWTEGAGLLAGDADIVASLSIPDSGTRPARVCRSAPAEQVSDRIRPPPGSRARPGSSQARPIGWTRSRCEP